MAAPTACASTPFSHKPRSCAACTRAGCCFFRLPRFRRTNVLIRSAELSPMRLAFPSKLFFSRDFFTCSLPRWAEREQDHLLSNAQSGECPAFSQRVRATAPFPSVIGGGGLQTMGVMKQEDGQLFKCRARNPFAPCAGLLCPLLQSFRTQQRVYLSRPLLAETRRVLGKSPPLFRDSGGLFVNVYPSGKRGTRSGFSTWRRRGATA